MPRALANNSASNWPATVRLASLPKKSSPKGVCPGWSAAAGGRVIYSNFHPQYGNIIEIDHGNGLITRYAHLSKRDVKVGDVVLSRSKIGAVGSTGQSTGPHLHFEVRQNGTPLNPVRFLRLAS